MNEPTGKGKEEEDKHVQIQSAIRRLGQRIDEIDYFINDVESGPAPPKENKNASEVPPSLATVLDKSAQTINEMASRIPDQLIRLRGLLF